MRVFAPQSFDEQLKLLTVIGVLGSFLFGVYQWRGNQVAAALERSSAELKRKEERERDQLSARRESLKPFLNLQLGLYGEATRIAALIATAEDGEARRKALTRFWELYYGELVLVEAWDVELGMVAMRNAILAEQKAVDDAARNSAREAMQRASLAIAQACRKSLGISWGIGDWISGKDPSADAPNRPIQPTRKPS